jgi:hypothetical protein
MVGLTAFGKHPKATEITFVNKDGLYSIAVTRGAINPVFCVSLKPFTESSRPLNYVEGG